MEEQGRSPVGRYRSDLRNVVGSSASAYGYTLTVWSTGMILSQAYGPPNPPEVFSFFTGAVLAFATVGVLAFGGVSVEFGAAVGAAWFASAHVPSFPGWLLGAFVATAAYLAGVGAENATAEVGRLE